MSGPPAGAATRPPGVIAPADEWKEARTVINSADSQLSDLRKYGLTFVSGLLAAQGLIEFPLKSASQAVPDSVKFAILVASFFLILGIFDLDRRTRTIQRAAAQRACMLEGDDGLTKVISRTYQPNESITSIDVLYLIFILATTTLGLAVLGVSSFPPSSEAVGLLVIALLSAAVVVFFGRPLRGGWHRDRPAP
jgi:hypothetical protein